MNRLCSCKLFGWVLQLGNLQVGPDGGILQVPIQRHHARGKDMAGADITCLPKVREHAYTTTSHSSNRWRIPRRHYRKREIRKNGRERETFGKVWQCPQFLILSSTPVTSVAKFKQHKMWYGFIYKFQRVMLGAEKRKGGSSSEIHKFSCQCPILLQGCW